MGGMEERVARRHPRGTFLSKGLAQEMEAGRVDIVVTVDDFRYYWKKAKERTSSAYSKLHFGHYKSAAFSDLLSEVHASL